MVRVILVKRAESGKYRRMGLLLAPGTLLGGARGGGHLSGNGPWRWVGPRGGAPRALFQVLGGASECHIFYYYTCHGYILVISNSSYSRTRTAQVTSSSWLMYPLAGVIPSNLHPALHAAHGHHKEQLTQRDLPPFPPSSLQVSFAGPVFSEFARLCTSVPVLNIPQY